MVRSRHAEVVWLIVALLAALGIAALSAKVAGDRARAGLAASVLTDAQLRASLLDSEIARFSLVPLALADDRDVVATLAGQSGEAAMLSRKLEALAQTTGAAALYVVDRNGMAVAASNWNTPASFIGNDYRFRRYVREARERGAGSQFALGTVSREPGLYLSRRVASGGIVVIKLAFDRLETDWARAGGDTFVRDRNGVVLVTSRPAWRFAGTRPLTPAILAAVEAEARVPPGTVRPLRIEGDRVSQTVKTGQSGWTLTLSRISTQPVHAAQRVAAFSAGLGALALAALAWALRQRGRLARRRTADLEEAVAVRTAELTQEIEERAASEARAAELRESLRQANRLATLGQVTASVAHETAQPVAAIRTYARTTEQLLDRGDYAAVRANLTTIAGLSDRIGAVTGELRGFARRRSGQQRPVPVSEVVDGALLILKEQLRPIRLVRPAVDPALLVSGGRVRLEQVLVNVLQNALEALRGQQDAQIVMDISIGPKVVLSVQDNGPGIAPDVASRLFTPFVTSRAEGLGLGLVISHDIMVELGGTLRLAQSAVGARFEIEMVAA